MKQQHLHQVGIYNHFIYSPSRKEFNYESTDNTNYSSKPLMSYLHLEETSSHPNIFEGSSQSDEQINPSDFDKYL